MDSIRLKVTLPELKLKPTQNTKLPKISCRETKFNEPSTKTLFEDHRKNTNFALSLYLVPSMLNKNNGKPKYISLDERRKEEIAERLRNSRLSNMKKKQPSNRKLTQQLFYQYYQEQYQHNLIQYEQQQQQYQQYQQELLNRMQLQQQHEFIFSKTTNSNIKSNSDAYR